jgi:hypothetical protein
VNRPIPLYFETKFGKKKKKDYYLTFLPLTWYEQENWSHQTHFSLSGAQGFDTSVLKQSVEPSKSLERRYNRPVHALAKATSLSLFNARSNSLCRMSLMQHDTSVLLLTRVILSA